MGKQKKISILILGLLLTVSIGSARMESSNAFITLTKYISLASFYFYLGSFLCNMLHIQPKKARRFRHLLGACSLCVFVCFVLLTLDTFLFHAISWFPGMLRYPIFDAYGVLYTVFILLGICTYLGTTPMQKEDVYE